MKVVPFQVPHTRKEAFRIQKDRLPYFYDKLHQHHEVQIMLIEESEGTLIAGDYVGRFEPGDLYIIGSAQAHVFRNDEAYYEEVSKLEAASLSIYFDEKYLGDHFWELEEMESTKDFLARVSRGMRVTGNTRKKIIGLLNAVPNQSGIEKIVSFFTMIKVLSESNDLHILSVSVPMDSSSNEGKRMNDILQFTFQQSHRKIYIDEVAKVANLSPEAFCRYFKTRTGKTYTNFLNEVRVSNACKLLFEKDLTVHEVCHRSGFTNLSNFNRVFKNIKGNTPSSYTQKISSSL